jgi:hypothetical protein
MQAIGISVPQKGLITVNRDIRTNQQAFIVKRRLQMTEKLSQEAIRGKRSAICHQPSAICEYRSAVSNPRDAIPYLSTTAGDQLSAVCDHRLSIIKGLPIWAVLFSDRSYLISRTTEEAD